MEAADGAINPKVIVQFSDPNNLFDAVAALLNNYLPLTNLHWKSPSRPLRSIEELDVSLNREENQSRESAPNVRRHQIPGLRQTPFVRVLLLRCDDKDKYRDSVRKEVKDWVKSLGFSTSGKPTNKGQERHDAFEYIILHVVLPGTFAASQPKSSKHISLEAAESTDSVNSKSKWTGKSTSTILDKLRADFSSSSKVPFERVAQIRLADPAKPSTVLSPLELEEQWQDLVEKLKTAILQSLDARVAQYEDDIRERENQRILPGWNFCTFFILKEGLARGFENVGLLEDAIKIYEELDLGLDIVIQDQAKQDYSDAANALLPFATDLKDVIRMVLDNRSQSNGLEDHEVGLSLQDWTNAEAKRFPWKLERRNYQQMILTNQVSALDFRIYIFTRQMQIMLRRAGTSIPLPKTKQKRQSGPRWDADLLSEICERSIKFMNLAARNLRQDLLTAWGGQEGLPQDEMQTQKIAVDNIVASWKWSSILQTLSECHISSSFVNIIARLHKNPVEWVVSGSAQADIDKHEKSPDTHTNAVSPTENHPLSHSARILEDLDTFSNLRIVKGSKTELLFWAAELFKALRTVFLQVCQQSRILPNTLNPLTTHAIDFDASIANKGLRSPSLSSATSSESNALGAYKLLTMYACHCYISSNKLRASRTLLFDLAKLELHSENYEAASRWLDAVPEMLQTVPRTHLEQSMLVVYADCLQKAGRTTDLVQALLLSFRSPFRDLEHDLHVDESLSKIQGATESKEAVNIPLQALFTVVNIDSHVSHHPSTDGASVTILLQSFFPLAKLGTLRAKLEYRSRTHNPPTILTFSAHSGVTLSNGLIQLTLSTETTTEGWYEAKTLELFVGNVTLKDDLDRKAISIDDDQSVGEAPPRLWSIYMYPRRGSPLLEASHASLVDLSTSKRVSIRIAWGTNSIDTAHLRLKPATAGLRLDIASATYVDGTQFSISRIEDAYVLLFGNIHADSSTTVEIPYSLDDAGTVSGVVRAEMRYTVRAIKHDLYTNLALMTLLPIGISVQDYSLSHATFSRFTFAPSRLVPISILDCCLEGDVETTTLSNTTWDLPLHAYPKQPANWAVQIMSRSSQQVQLTLEVSYRCLDEVILETILRRFSQAICDSQFAFAARPLQSHFRSRLQAIWTEQELELALLTSEIEMWDYTQLDWTTLLNAFNKSNRQGLEVWLKQWHADEQLLNLRSDAAPTRKLRLLVEPPRPQLVVTTELTLSASRACIVGQPIMAQLMVFFTSHAESEFELAVEVNGQGDTWLVGGHKKFTLSSTLTEYKATIILLAQKTGSLLLPSVDVKLRDRVAGEPSKEVAFELDNLSVASMVQVKSEIQSTTLGFEDSEGGEIYWLIDSQRLQAGNQIPSEAAR